MSLGCPRAPSSDCLVADAAWCCPSSPPCRVGPGRRIRKSGNDAAQPISARSVQTCPDRGAPHLNAMATFVFRLISPRPTFAFDMNDEERAVMARHAAHWQAYLDSGKMVVFGPVVDGTGSWGLGVVEAEHEEELRSFADSDPVVTTGTGKIELARMLFGFVRGQ
jgi:uncharacterized protein